MAHSAFRVEDQRRATRVISSGTFFLRVGHDRRCAYRQQCVGRGVHDHVVRDFVIRGFRAVMR